jgi:hypothetical protein
MQWSYRHPSSLPYPRASAWSETPQRWCVEHAPDVWRHRSALRAVHEHIRIGREAGIEPINQAIVEMDTVTHQNAALVGEAAAAAQSLQEQTAERNTAVARYSHRMCWKTGDFGISGNGGAFPFQVGIDRLALRLDRAGRAEVEIVTLDLHHTRLGLTNPVRKQRNKHAMSERLQLFVHMERGSEEVELCIDVAGRPACRVRRLRRRVRATVPGAAI